MSNTPTKEDDWTANPWGSVRDRMVRSNGETANGSLRDRQFLRILASMSRDDAAGALRAQCIDENIELLIEEGHVVLASGSKPELWLGTILLEEGVLTAAELEAVLDLQRNSRTRWSLGSHLIEEGATDRQVLCQCLTRQATRVVQELVSWTGRPGIFTLDRTVPAPPPATLERPDAPLEVLLARAVGREL